MKRIFRNGKLESWLIAIGIGVLILLWSVHARAEQTLTFEAGSAMLRGETPVIGVNIACKECGPVRTDYEFGFDLIGESEHYRYNSNVIQLHAQMVDGYKRFEMGLGFFYQNVEQEYTCQFGFHILARFRPTDRLALQWRHSSSGSSCTPNAGRDLLTVGWRF